MGTEPRICSVEERRRGVVEAIVQEGHGMRRPYSDMTQVIEFYPGKSTLPQPVLDAIRAGIVRRCWCDRFGPVRAENTVGQLQTRVYNQQVRQCGARPQPDNPDECCT